MTPLANLELAVSHIDSAVAALNLAALAADTDVADEAKQIAVYLRHQAASIHALQMALTPDLTTLLERTLGGEVGEACS